MQCEENSKLRTPLSEVCQTTDIGCVSITDGEPTCSPQPDELPFAFDPKTTTLWIFSCKTHEWIAFGKFSVCQLNALNLENITNICDVLNIAVNYAGSGECQQGTVTLAELAERILECLKLKTKIITIGEGEGNKFKITIDGLPLDPVYVTGRNIWSEGGSGTESDPLIVATHDPICKWPTKTQAQVDAANTKHLGACIDGEMARVPFPETDLCKSEQLTLEQAQAKGSNLTIVACDEGNVVRIPVSQSGFFDRDYICVPGVIGKPANPPLEGTGPIRIGCNGELYVWLCEERKWETVTADITSFSSFQQGEVSNICNNLRFPVWFQNGSDTSCLEKREITLSQLFTVLKSCDPGEDSDNIYWIGEWGTGACYVVSHITGPAVINLHTRQTVVGGAEINYKDGQSLEIAVYNPFDKPSLLVAEGWVSFSSREAQMEWTTENNNSVGLGMKMSLDFSPDDNGFVYQSLVGYDFRSGMCIVTDQKKPFSWNSGGSGVIPHQANVCAGQVASLHKILNPGERKTLYCVPYSMHGGVGDCEVHYYMSARAYVLKGGVIVP